jgi:hypothetical protein
MDYVDCEIDGIELRVYPCGKVERFLHNNWNRVGYVCSNLRFRVTLKGSSYYIHRIIYHVYCHYEFDIDDLKQQIDHINGNPQDNRIENLRVVTNQQNQWNQTRAEGVIFEKNRNKWKAYISVNGKQKNLGRFNTEEEAIQSRLCAKPIYHFI